MAVLSDRDIRERLKTGGLTIEPLDNAQVGPASIDFRLGNEFRVFVNNRRTHIDPASYGSGGDYTKLVKITDDSPFIIHSGEFVLGVTIESVKIPCDLIGILHGRSSIGRLGIQVHATSGFVNPGFCGRFTLEMSNISRMPIALYPGMRICQLMLEKLNTPSETPYGNNGSKYVGDRGPTISKISLDFGRECAGKHK
jgi:dCTP deaminase